VVHVLAADGGSYALALCGSLNAPLIPELSLLLHQVPLDCVVVTVIELAVLDGTELGSVCLGEHLTVLDWLNSAVVVILVDLLVYCGVDLLVLVRLDRLVSDCGRNSLVDCGVMMTRAVGEVGESCLDFVHCDGCCVVVDLVK